MTEATHPNATEPDAVDVPRVGTVEAYLCGYPAVSFESIRITAKRDLGMDFNDLGNADTDGSIDLSFGPKAPAGQKLNWLEAVPGRGYYVMFRFYSPTEPLFDGTSTLPDVEIV